MYNKMFPENYAEEVVKFYIIWTSAQIILKSSKKNLN